VDPRSPRAARAVAAALFAGVMLGNLLVLRAFTGGVRAAVVAGLLALVVPIAPLFGLGWSASRIASERVEAGEGLRAGSVIKVTLVLSLLVGLVLAGVGFQLAYGPISQFYPYPGTLALMLYRGSLCLPAVGAGIVIGVGLLLVERPRVLLPGALVFLVADVGLARAWFERGSGLLSFELAGAGLALPVAALLGAIIAGTLLFAVEGARTTLGTHLARPFDLTDLPRLVRDAILPAGALAWVGGVAAAWFALACRGAAAHGVVSAATALLVAALLACSLVDDAVRRRRVDALTWVAVAVMVLVGLGLLIVPRWPLLLLSAVPSGEPMLGSRLVGAVVLQELALAGMAWAGLLRHRRSEGVELAVSATVVIVLAVVLTLAYPPTLPAMAGVLIVARGLTVPLLRSGR